MKVTDDGENTETGTATEAVLATVGSAKATGPVDNRNACEDYISISATVLNTVEYEFSHWTYTATNGGTVVFADGDAEAETSFTVTGVTGVENVTVEITANFTHAGTSAHTLTVVASPDNKGNTTVATGKDVSPIGGNFYRVKHGSTVELTATPAGEYKFAGWKIGNTVLSTTSPYDFRMTGDAEITGYFVEVDIEKEIFGGTVVDYDDRIFAKSSASYYRFRCWLDGDGNILTVQNPLMLIDIPDGVKVTPYFVMFACSLDIVTVGVGEFRVVGERTPTVAPMYLYGTEVTLEATGNFLHWEFEGGEIITANPYVFEITRGEKVKAVFQ
jgi:hypothetical protein